MILQGCSSSAIVSTRNRAAIAIYSVYLGIFPNPVVFYKRGYAFSDLGGVSNRRRAISDYDRALVLSPGYQAAYGARAISRSLLGYHGLAIDDLSKCISIDPKTFEAASCYNSRAVTNERMKRYATVFADYNQAISIDPQYVPAYKNRGIAFEDAGDIESACKDWRKAASLGDVDSADWVRKQCQ